MSVCVSSLVVTHRSIATRQHEELQLRSNNGNNLQVSNSQGGSGYRGNNRAQLASETATMTTRTTVFLEPELVWVSTDGFFVGNSGSFFFFLRFNRFWCCHKLHSKRASPQRRFSKTMLASGQLGFIDAKKCNIESAEWGDGLNTRSRWSSLRAGGSLNKCAVMSEKANAKAQAKV